jgi:ribosomal peptide maturation radical SAM protein 1
MIPSITVAQERDSLPQVRTFRVALIGMPFGVEVNAPSIQLGLLRAVAERTGFPTDTHHLTLDLAQRLTAPVYNELCLHRGHMTGEWLFAIAAFGVIASEDEAYFAAFPEELEWFKRLGKDKADVIALRHDILPRFIEDCLGAVDWGEYGVVGFSSTFQQNVASLALARRIKERYPGVTIVFGGANLDGEMGPEYVRAFPFIDCAVVGEGDDVFPRLLRYLARGEPLPDLPGLAVRVPEGVRFSGQALPVRNLDALPTPVYDEYFARARHLGLFKEGQRLSGLPVESARGCWWGAKQHCTFCGLNALGMAFRAKSPQRFFAELDELALKYGVSSFQATDNIVDMKYIREVFATIASAKMDYHFFYEVKANLTREQLRSLYLGGVRSLQPGIESLSTHVLQLMRKGSTMLKNVRLLKWCRYYNFFVYWNLIWGFPGETEDDYRRELQVLECLSHLQPPSSTSRIWLERFAPYFTDRANFPIRDLRPEASYRYVYPPQVDLEKVAYFFDYSMDETVPDEAHKPTQEWVREWRRRWASDKPDTLIYRRLQDTMFIDDHRWPGPGTVHTLRGVWALAYDYCGETDRTVPQILEHVGHVTVGFPMTDWEMLAGLQGFCQQRLMVSEDGHYLSLALPANPNW